MKFDSHCVQYWMLKMSSSQGQALPALEPHRDIVQMSVDKIQSLKISDGEEMHWFETYPTLESLLPDGVDASTLTMIQAFMGWLDFVIPDSLDRLEIDCILARKRNRRPRIAWLWMNSENLSQQIMYKLVYEAAHFFHDRVVFCLVYHPNTFVKEANLVEVALSIKLRKMEQPFAMERTMKSICLDVPTPELHSSDDEQPLKMGDDDEESE